MSKNSKTSEIDDEPGAEDRFLKGVRKALETPPKPYTAPTDKAKKGESEKRKRK
jgi:hypothetical protein